MPFIIAGALIIGLTLGLMGSGGSILTVPVLVYLLGHDGKVAIAESLAIVGGIAAVSMLPYARGHLVSWRSVLFFGIPGMAGTYGGAWLAHYVDGTIQLILFGLVMLLAAGFMMKRRDEKDLKQSSAHSDDPANAPPEKSAWVIGLEGLVVGVITGLVGVGGGFLIVPALVVLGKLPMRVAVGTSLAVIAMKSLSGFVKYLDVLADLGSSVDWMTVGLFVLIGVLGSFAGHRLATHMNQIWLQRLFATFLVGVGVFVLLRESPKLFSSGPPPAASPVDTATATSPSAVPVSRTTHSRG